MVYFVTYVSEAYFVQDDDVAWWVDSRATIHVCKDRCWFKTYESLNDGSILHMGNDSSALVHGRGCVDLRFSFGKIVSLLNIVNDNIGSAFMSTSKLNDLILRHAILGHVHYKRMQDTSKDGLILAFDMNTEKCFAMSLIKRFKTDRGGEYMDTLYFQSVGIIHETTAPILYNKMGCRPVVRLHDPKLETLSQRGIECIFVGYAEHSKAFRFYAIEPNESVLINSMIESRDVIFDENRMRSFDQCSYCFNVEDDHNTFDKAMKSHNVALWEIAINDEMVHHGIQQLGGDVLKKFNYFDCTPVSTPMDTSEKLMPNNGQLMASHG
ncbi:hypothetical protein Tco_0875710 [Tanacetum coccineum]|uniref:Zinc finger, CCHC-type n=1 Tax=Tanacetum coccineum TaxID=301880 RepID=A0ABQ5BVV9_9ASTR